MRSILSRPRFVLFVLVILTILYALARFKVEIQTTIHSAARPLWSSPIGPSRIIPHFHAEDMFITENTCTLHGWPLRDPMEYYQRELWDAIILTGPTDAELDLLEIRLFEQIETVDKVFVLESNRTINGTPKPLYFKDQLYDRFDQFQYKIVYHELLSPPPYDHAYPSPSAWAAHERDQMTSLLRTRVYNTVLPPIVIFAAPDEIAYPSTLRLMRECVFPSPMHLQMRRYLYSFEWPLGWRSWEAQVHVWDTRTVEKEKEKEAESKQGEGGVEGEKEGEEADEDAEALAERKRKEAVKEEKWKTEYGHGKVSEWALADAGWHCSHCMKKLDDVLEKVKDEKGKNTGSLSKEYIQDVLCQGKDIFNIIPEAYSYKDMLELMSVKPSKSGMGLPRTVLERGDQFKYLLPGGCVREA